MAAEMSPNWVPGLDVSGHIIALGDTVQDFQIGDQVLCHGNMFLPHGGLAEYSIQDSRTLFTTQNSIAAAYSMRRLDSMARPV